MTDGDVEAKAWRLCVAAGEDPRRERWEDYIEPARATLAAEAAAKEPPPSAA